MLELLNDSIGIKGAIGIFLIIHKQLDRHLKDAVGQLPIIHKRLNWHLKDVMGSLSITLKRLNWQKMPLDEFKLSLKHLVWHIKDALFHSNCKKFFLSLFEG